MLCFLHSLEEGCLFCVISSLGFCKLPLQLDIFSYTPQNLLGNCSWHLCSPPEYVLARSLGTFRYSLRILWFVFLLAFEIPSSDESF